MRFSAVGGASLTKRFHLFGALAFRKPPRKRQLNAWVAKFGLAPTSESQDRYTAELL